MLYLFIRYTMSVAYRVYFRKIYFSNRHRVPNDIPVVMPLNHPTAFTEPTFVGTFVPKFVHVLLKGNIFSTPLLRKVLASLNMIPIFRARDGGGFASLRQNAETMEFINQKLIDGEIILIMAEGLRKHEKRLRPIQKGAARMVFKYYQTSQKDDLAIVNVSANYTESTKFRSDIFMDVSEPIWLKDYINLYKENDRKAINQLTKDIKTKLLERVIHIDQQADDELVNHLLDFNRNVRETKTFPILEDNDKPLYEEMAIAQKVNNMEESTKEDLQKKLTAYLQKLKDSQIQDYGVVKPGFYNFNNFLLIILGAFPALVGYLTNCLPLLYTHSFAQKKADGPELFASIRPFVGMVSYLLYFLVLLIILLILGNTWLLGFLFLMPFLGYFSLIWKEVGEQWNWARQFRKLSKEHQEDILKLRNEVFCYFD